MSAFVTVGRTAGVVSGGSALIILDSGGVELVSCGKATGRRAALIELVSGWRAAL